MGKFKSFFIFLVLSIGLSSLSFSEDDFGESGFPHWQKRLLESRDSKNVVLLEMLGEAAEIKSDGFTFRILKSHGPYLFYGDTPNNERDFQRLLLNLSKTHDLEKFKSFYGIKDGESDLHVARIFQTVFYLYAAIDTGFTYQLRENLKETLSWGWSDPDSPELISQIVKSMDELLGPKVSYHIRARVKNIQPVGGIDEIAVVIEWELAEVENSYNPKSDKLETTENVVEERIVREFVAKAEADKIEEDYGTKVGLPIERDAAIILFQNLSKTTRIVENPLPGDIGTSNWERLMPLLLPVLPGKMSFVLIPAGTFQMGSPNGEPGRSNYEALHNVILNQDFEMMTTEVTQKQWEEVMGSNPSRFKGEDRPVETVSWDDIQAFIQKFNERNDGYSYRLPTEAEWEYAARAGTQTAYSFGDNAALLSQFAWFSDISGGQTQPVAQKRPNEFGLFDMHGNVWEWVLDAYSNDYSKAVSQEKADEIQKTPRSDGSSRVFRGGGWLTGAQYLRSAYRGYCSPDDRHRYLGFRALRTKK